MWTRTIETERTEQADVTEETGGAGVKMVGLWILLTIVLYALIRQRRRSETDS